MTEKKTAKHKKPVKKKAHKAHAHHPRKKKGEQINIYSMDGKAKHKLELPEVFHEEYRPDLIRRAVDSSRANRRQPYGPSPTAGMRHAVDWPGKGRGLARTPRTRSGSGVGAQAPNTRGGRRAHPPRVEHDKSKALNKKEKQKARRSAFHAISVTEIVQSRGHKFDEKLTLPVVVEDKLDEIKNTKDAVEFLKKLGIYDDVERAKNGTKIRAGHGKMRGRRFKKPKSFLLVVEEPKHGKVFRNLPGVDIITSSKINTEHLAPGGDPGRLALFTESAFKKLEAMPGALHLEGRDV